LIDFSTCLTGTVYFVCTLSLIGKHNALAVYHPS
jgi:hypothetical protein